MIRSLILALVLSLFAGALAPVQAAVDAMNMASVTDQAPAAEPMQDCEACGPESAEQCEVNCILHCSGPGALTAESVRVPHLQITGTDPAQLGVGLPAGQTLAPDPSPPRLSA